MLDSHPKYTSSSLYSVREGVPDACLGHFEDGAILALHSLQEPWLWELELQVQVGQLIVAPGLWLLLDKLREVAPVLGQAQVLIVDDACNIKDDPYETFSL